MKITQWIRGYDTRTDELKDEWLIHEFDDLPEYWEEILPIEHNIASALLGKDLPYRLHKYFLEMEAQD